MRVNIDGHMVDPRDLDRFFNGSDGSRVTDEQWDESRDRRAESEADLKALGFSYVGSCCPAGDEIAGGGEHVDLESSDD